MRAPKRNELRAIADVLLADAAGGGSPDLDADFVANQWGRAGFDLSADAWVVIDGAGSVVGYGQVVLEEPGIAESWGVIHPAHRGRGLGAALLDRIEARASDLLAGQPAPRFRHGINAGDAAAAGLVRSRGLNPLRHFWHMQADLPSAFDAGTPPGGIRVAPAKSHDDVVAIHAVLFETLAGEWRGRPDAFDAWWEEARASPTHDPSLWFLARAGDEPAGALTASASEDRGWIDELGVLAAFRGRGVGAALLRQAFAELARRGRSRVKVNVDAENPTGATSLYERVGMRVTWAWDLWERSLEAPGS